MLFSFLSGFLTAYVLTVSGCLFHGCLCIKNRRKNIPGSNITMDEAHNRTLEKRDYIIKKGHDYEEVTQLGAQLKN